MTPDELRERVARAMRDVYLSRQPKYSGAGNYPLEEFLPEADAAIDLLMEEAAEASRPPAHMLGSTDSYANGYRAACADIAAALRAYVRKQNC